MSPLRLRLLAVSVSLAASLLPGAALGASSSSASSASSSAGVTIKSGEHVRGRPKADITIVEYGDLQCPFCQQLHPVMLQLVRKYRNKVSWMFRQYPLSFHVHAQSAAEASECVAYLGGNSAFWGFVDTIMEKKTFTPADYLPVAKRFGISEPLFTQCMSRGIFTQKVKDQRKGGELAGVEGTPTVFIVSRKGRYQETIVGSQSIDQYTAIIDRMLKENAAKALGGFTQP
jgi:protein-disulfide isomerase